MTTEVSATGATPSHARQSATICIVTETYPPEINGVAMTVSRLTTALLEAGHRIQVVCPHRSDRELPEPDGGFELVPVPGLPLPRYKDLRFGLPARRRIRRLWKRQVPDVIYIATEGPLGWSVMREAARWHVPVVSGFHTNFHTYCRHYRLGWIEPWVRRYLTMFHARTACTLVPTDALRRELEGHGLYNARVLGRGVDTELFTPARRSPELRASWGLREDELAVLYVGRIAPEKNLQLAVDTFRALQGIREDARFVLVGDGPLVEELKSRNSDFVFCGMREGEDLASHYASGDLFLFPSLTETFGNVVLEAMASGLPVVAFDCAAAEQHIAAYRSGIVVKPGHDAAFLHAAVTLAADKVVMRGIRVAARHHALEHTWPQVAARFEALLLKFAGNQPGMVGALGYDS